MNSLPAFLLPELNLSGDWNITVENLYVIFKKDFLGNNLYFDGKKIAIDRRILPDGMGKEESFWHLISKETRQARQAGRLPDFPRAKRLHWIRPIIENFKDPLIYCWKYLEGNKKIRIYLWLRNFNHLVILEKIKNKTILVTAFTVSLGKEKDLLRRYDKKI